MTPRIAAFALIVLMLSSACSEDATSSGTSGQGGAGQGGAGQGGMAEGASGGAVVAAREALILGESVNPPLTPRSRVIAGFHAYASDPEVCNDAGTFGSCNAFVCMGSAPNPTRIDAGTITLLGGLRDVTMSFDNGYAPDDAVASLFDAGQMLTFAASGAADVLPFEATLEAPKQVDLVEPLLTLPIDKDVDLTLSWTGADVGVFTLGLSAGFEPEYFVRCQWNAADGTGVVPAAALDHVSGTGTTFVARVKQATTTTSGPWEVGLELDAAVNANGSEAFATVAIQ